MPGADDGNVDVPSGGGLASATGRSGLLLIGSSLMLLVGVLGIAAASGLYVRGGDSSLWFVGLILISLAGLAMTAAIFRGLGFRKRDMEAFGLPTGSVRAILAIAITVLLVIFGLPMISVSGPDVLGTAPVASASVDCAAVDAERQRYESHRLLAVVDTRDCKASIGAAAGGAGAASPRQKARIALYGSVLSTMPAEQREQGKQLLTAVLTLLTTIVGFYFGSQSALVIAKQMRPTPDVPLGNTGSGKLEGGA